MTSHLEIAVRAYTEKKAQKPPFDPPNRQPSEWSLIFDTETTVDAAQSLRVGGYQIRKGDKLHEAGLFYVRDALTDTEVKLLQDYAADRNVKLMTEWKFIHDVFYCVAYDWVGTVIGFNLPFDLSRLAIAHSPARKSMNGGFSFMLSADRRKPRVRVKHLSRRAALIDFASPMGQASARGERRRGLNFQPRKGFFVDVGTIAAALTSRRFTLAGLCDHLQTETRKVERDDHGQALTADYLDYLQNDVQATWECFVALRGEYRRHRLSRPLHKILSEASVGKAYLREMGLATRLENQRDFPRDLFGKVMCAYYGGRAEVRLRRTLAQVCYCDFKSMYPTVNTLTGLWRYVLADSMNWREATHEVRCFLETVSASGLQDQATWRKLTAIVKIRPDGDLSPVRAKYDGRAHTIGLNPLTCKQGLWYTLADAVAAKMLTGKTPHIEEAIFFEPGDPQPGLKPIDLFGKPEFRVDPYADDVFRKMVELRDRVRDDPERQTEQQAIKIISNATSYGIFIEVQSDGVNEPEPIRLWGPDGELDVEPSRSIEQPGNFFDAALGAFITGAARLMLALAERRTLDEELGWVFCDTDSLAIARPNGMEEAEFLSRADRVIDWFKPLNPYEAGGSILQLEKHNLDPVTKQRRALFAWAISAKRYALFNIGDDGRAILRKASAHGLGHLRAPYPEHEAPASIPPPVVKLSTIGVDRWQYDLWFKVIEAGLSGSPDMVPLDWHAAFEDAAASRYGATGPEILGWFDPHNEGRTYAEQVKPFNFLLAFSGKNGAWAPYRDDVLDALPGRGRPKKLNPDIQPVASFTKNHREAEPFDRETGEPISRDQLMSYAEALNTYHLSEETKFENGRAFDRGLTVQRHIVAHAVRLIGKETNKVGEFGEPDLVAEACLELRASAVCLAQHAQPFRACPDYPAS
jgi:hypothetical protein